MSKYHNAGSRARLTDVRYENPFPKSDELKPREGFGKAGRGVCPHCDTEVNLRQAGPEYRNWDIQDEDIVCANHAVGGGKKTRRSYFCPGSGLKPINQ